MHIQSMFRVLSVIATITAFPMTSVADATGDAIVAAAPCTNADRPQIKGAQAGLRTCKTLINGDGTYPGIIALVKELVRTNVEKTLKAPSNTGVQMCVLAPNPLVLKDGQPVSEEFTNRSGQSCGTPMTVVVQTNPTVVQFKMMPPLGTLESGWIAGAQFQAVAYYLGEVTGEIQSQRQFSVRSYSHGPSYAASMAKDYASLLQARNNLYSVVSARSDATDILTQTAKCVATGFGKTGDTATAQVASQLVRAPSAQGQEFGVSQQVGQLCSAQIALENAYVNLAATEIMGHGQDAHFSAMGSQQAYQNMIQWIMDTMKMACRNAGVSGANQCYHDNVGSKLRDYIRGVWPVSQQSISVVPTKASNELASPFFVFASLAPGLRGKRRPKQQRKSRRLLRLGFALLVLGALVTACDGGGGGSNITASTRTQLIQPPANQQCPFGMAQFKIECCNPDGTLNTQLCTDPNTLLDHPIQAGLTNGGSNISNGNTSLSNAAGLFGIPKNVLGQNTGAGAQALSNNLAANSANTAGDNSTTATDGSSTPGATTGSPGDSTPSGGGGGPFDSSSGSLTPASNGGSENSASSGGSLAALAGATPGGGGNYKGAPAQGDGNPDVPPGFFGDLGGGGPRDPASSAFAKGQDPTKTMGTGDPEDYFTRIGLDDSIFKIVSRRYRAKAFSWAMNQSQSDFKEASQAVGKK